MEILRSNDIGLCILLWPQGGSKIGTGGEDTASGSALLLTLSYGLGIGFSYFKAGNAMLKCDSMWQVVEVVIGGVPTVRVDHFMC